MKAPTGFPTKLHIAGTTWTVEYVSGLLSEWSLHGQCRHAERRIVIAGDQHPDVMRTTLLHEALHACLNVNSGHQLDQASEEIMVRSLEAPLLSLIRDNKIKWS